MLSGDAREKQHTFEVRIEGEPRSVVLADHIEGLDWRNLCGNLMGRLMQVELANVRPRAGS